MLTTKGNNNITTPPAKRKGPPPRNWKVVMSSRAGYRVPGCEEILKDVFNLTADNAKRHIDHCIKHRQSDIYISTQDIVLSKIADAEARVLQSKREGNTYLGLIGFRPEMVP